MDNKVFLLIVAILLLVMGGIFVFAQKNNQIQIETIPISEDFFDQTNREIPPISNPYIDPELPIDEIIFNSINGIYPNQAGVVNLTSSDNSVLITNDFFSSTINLKANPSTVVIVGGSGRTYTSGTPSTLQVDNDANTISQNFDGNFWRLFALGEPYIDGNALNVINSLDLNNSLSYAKTDTNSQTACDGNFFMNGDGVCIDNENYVWKNGKGIQQIFSSTTTSLRTSGHITPTTTGSGSLGQTGFRWGPSFINQITGNPGAGNPVLYVPAGTASFCGLNTDACIDYNGSRFIAITDMNVIEHLWGVTGSAGGGQYRRPLTSAPTLQAPAVYPESSEYDHNYGTPYFYQPMKLRNNVWQHEDSIVYFGTPKDATVDQNITGDSNRTGSIIQDGNYTFDSGLDSNGMTISKLNKDWNFINYDLNGSINFYKKVDNTMVLGLRLHETGTRVNFPFLAGTVGCGLDATFSGELFCTPSLASLKVNIEDFNNTIDPNILYLLKPKLFNGIENPNGHKLAGFLAEDVLETAPFFAVHDETGMLRGVDYKGLNILTISALQVQNRKILDLEQKVNDLNSELRLFKQGFCMQFPNNPSCIVIPGV